MPATNCEFPDTTRAGTHACTLEHLQELSLCDLPDDVQLHFTIPDLCIGLILAHQGDLQVRLHFSPRWKIPEELQQRLECLSQDLDEIIGTALRDSSERIQSETPDIEHLDWDDGTCVVIIKLVGNETGADILSKVKAVTNSVLSETLRSFQDIASVFKEAML